MPCLKKGCTKPKGYGRLLGKPVDRALIAKVLCAVPDVASTFTVALAKLGKKQTDPTFIFSDESAQWLALVMPLSKHTQVPDSEVFAPSRAGVTG